MSNKYRKQRRAKRYEPRRVRTPLVGRSCEKMSLDMHVALGQLFTSPNTLARDSLADTLNVVGLMIQGDPRFPEELAVLNQAAEVLDPYQAPDVLDDDSRHVLAHAASVIDTILGLLDVETLRAAELAYVAIMKSMRKPQLEHAA